MLVGAACTSVLVGVFVFDRFLFSPTTSSTKLPSSCGLAAKFSSYAQLQKYETTREFKDSVVKRLDIVFLGSNSPIEDRFVVGTSENLGSVFLSMIDGHKGTHCAQYLQKNMLQHLSAHLHAATASKDDLRIVLDMDTVEKNVLSQSSNEDTESLTGGISDVSWGELTPEKISKELEDSLGSLDDKISNVALEDVKAILSGHSMTGDMRSRILTALEGACALTAVVRQEDMFVANTGDCRVVLGQNEGGKKWTALPLTVDQNAKNPDEVKRLLAAHPGEESTTILAGRVLGGLMPFRTFGDVDYKWEKKYLENLVPLPPVYKSPPYVTAEPVMSHHKLLKTNKFLILASDGFWERVSNKRAVNIVAEVLANNSQQRKKLPIFKRYFGKKERSDPCCSCENVATTLLWHALGGTEANVSRLLQLDPKFRRGYRDDITIIVVYL